MRRAVLLISSTLVFASAVEVGAQSWMARDLKLVLDALDQVNRALEVGELVESRYNLPPGALARLETMVGDLGSKSCGPMTYDVTDYAPSVGAQIGTPGMVDEFSAAISKYERRQAEFAELSMSRRELSGVLSGCRKGSRAARELSRTIEVIYESGGRALDAIFGEPLGHTYISLVDRVSPLMTDCVSNASTRLEELDRYLVALGAHLVDAEGQHANNVKSLAASQSTVSRQPAQPHSTDLGGSSPLTGKARTPNGEGLFEVDPDLDQMLGGPGLR